MEEKRYCNEEEWKQRCEEFDAHLKKEPALPDCMMPDGGNGACQAYLSLEAAIITKDAVVTTLRAERDALQAQLATAREKGRREMLQEAYSVAFGWSPVEGKGVLLLRLSALPVTKEGE